MTKPDTPSLQRLSLQKAAYRRVVSAWGWVEERAQRGNYSDIYLEGLSPEGHTGVMPVAETLMCLLNTSEDVYRQLGLPQAGGDLLERVAKDLANAFDKHRFSGTPYVVSREGDARIDFVDATCYLIGALVRLLPVRGSQQDSSAFKQILDSSVRFLVDAAVEIPDTEKNGLGRMCGWSWGDPNAQTRKPFARCYPPQTYFTAQAFITLLEVIFDSHSLANEHAEAILERLVGAKRLLLDTMITAEDDRLAGWPDFSIELAERSGQDGMETYARTAKPLKEMTLYGLEALSYVYFYARESEYQSARADLRRRSGSLFDELVRFSDEDERRLAKAFSFASGLMTSDSLFEDSCEIQIPEPLNLKKGQHGYLESKGDYSEKSHYTDGTVPFNLLNACNFYLRYAEEMEENAEAITTWRAKELALVDSIVKKGFRGKAFTHPARWEEKRPEVIYASRTAVASLLSWGVSPVHEAAEGVSDEVLDLVTRLAATVGVTPAVAEEPAGTPSEELDPRPLVWFSFLAGIYLGQLDRVDDKSTDFPQFYDLRGNQSFERQEATRLNGRGLLGRLIAAVTGSRRTAKKEIAALLENKSFLSKPYIKILEAEKDALTSESRRERLEAAGRLQEKLLAQAPKLIRHKLEELYGA